MIRYSSNNMIVAEQIADTTAVIVFDNEELILTEIGIKHYGHKVNNPCVEKGEMMWWLQYLIDDNYFNTELTRNVLFEKFKQTYGYFSYYYNFKEPIEIIGKGNECLQYKQLFLEIKEAGGTLLPETTLILRRKNIHRNK